MKAGDSLVRPCAKVKMKQGRDPAHSGVLACHAQGSGSTPHPGETAQAISDAFIRNCGLDSDREERRQVLNVLASPRQRQQDREEQKGAQG